ncbi:MAG: glycosyl hydrolase family 28 protein [Sphingobacterium sp.]
MKKYIVLILLWTSCFKLFAQDYNASLFGCKSDGITNNMGSIQYAIDYIAKKGGGKLHFYVGRYLTGTFSLKSNVSIELHEGAVLVGSSNIFDYSLQDGKRALIVAVGQSKIQIGGKGVIDGQASLLGSQVMALRKKGYLDLSEKAEDISLIYFKASKGIQISGIMVQNLLGTAQFVEQCEDISLSNLDINSPGSIGIYVGNSKSVRVSNVFFKAIEKALVENGTGQEVIRENIRLANGKKI